MSAKSNAMNRYLSTRQLCVSAIMGTLVFIMTIVPRVPIPLGYAHLGDAMIFLVVLFAGRREGIVAGCIGSALADLIGGFPLWIGPTLLIKFLMAEVFWQIALKGTKKAMLFSIRTITGLVFSCLVMAAGYTLFGAILYDSLALGIASTPGLLMEGIVNIVAFYVAGAVLCRKGLNYDDEVA